MWRLIPRSGGPAHARFETLEDWTARPEPEIKYFSGIAVYRKTFDLPRAGGAAGKSQVYLDLGAVHALARVRVNGEDCGVAWTVPWRVDITHAVKATANRLEIEVANLWPNRMIGDAKFPDKTYTQTTYHPYKANHALLPSGLLGPVRIMHPESPGAAEPVCHRQTATHKLLDCPRDWRRAALPEASDLRSRASQPAGTLARCYKRVTSRGGAIRHIGGNDRWTIMKITTFTIGSLVAAAALAISVARATTNDLTSAIQRGLFEEEANQNLGAAIQAYQSVANQFDKDRKLAATAIFRLGECYRKQGNTNEAAAQYERVLREFSDQPTLVNLSQQNLALLGSPAPAAGAPGVPEAALQEQRRLLEEEIKLVERQLEAAKKQVQAGVTPSESVVPVERDLLNLKRQLAGLGSGQPVSAISTTRAGLPPRRRRATS